MQVFDVCVHESSHARHYLSRVMTSPFQSMAEYVKQISTPSGDGKQELETMSRIISERLHLIAKTENRLRKLEEAATLLLNEYLCSDADVNCANDVFGKKGYIIVKKDIYLPKPHN